MGLNIAKKKLKEIISFDLIDVQGAINTKGNYIHLSGTSKHSPLETKYNFVITIVGVSLIDSEDAIEPILTKALNDIYDYEISNAKNLEANSRIIKIEELLGYEIKVSLIEMTK